MTTNKLRYLVMDIEAFIKGLNKLKNKVDDKRFPDYEFRRVFIHTGDSVGVPEQLDFLALTTTSGSADNPVIEIMGGWDFQNTDTDKFLKWIIGLVPINSDDILTLKSKCQ